VININKILGCCLRPIRKAIGLGFIILRTIPTLLHKTIAEQAAAYLYHLAMNHPFVDGNKRTAFAVMDVFLRVNGYRLVAAMVVHGLTHILTFNIRDFARYAEVTAVHPMDMRS
jgi:hypothetical protein